MKKGKKEARIYDIERKKNTRLKLKNGIIALSKKKEYKDGKSITQYALSKYTRVSAHTIKQFPDIMDILEKEKNPGVELKNPVVDTERIRNLEEAVQVINTLTDMYKGVTEKYNSFLRKNTELNLANVRLMEKVKELDDVIEKYSNAYN